MPARSKRLYRTTRTSQAAVKTPPHRPALKMSAAQDEFDTLFADKDRPSKHPEDEVAAASSETEDQAPEAYDEKDDDDSEEPQQSSMRSRYYLPKLRSQANTGPKGVIADAQAFEQARRAQRRSLMRSKETAAPAQAYPALDGAYTPEEQSSDDDDDDDDFMEQWRQSRLRELQQRRMKSRSRTTSPGKRTYGSLTKVDAEGYLDAIEKVQTDTVVVVLIYDDTVGCPRNSISRDVVSLTLAAVRSERGRGTLHPGSCTAACDDPVREAALRRC